MTCNCRLSFIDVMLLPRWLSLRLGIFEFTWIGHFSTFDNFIWYWGMSILLKNSTKHVWGTAFIIFWGLMETLWLTKGFYPFFILADNFAISSCCVVIYQNITSDASTIIRYKNVQEKTVRYVKKIVVELGNTIFIIKFKI